MHNPENRALSAALAIVWDVGRAFAPEPGFPRLTTPLTIRRDAAARPEAAMSETAGILSL